MVTDPWGLGFGDTLPSIRFMVLLLIGSLGIVPVAGLVAYFWNRIPFRNETRKREWVDFLRAIGWLAVALVVAAMLVFNP